MATAQQSKAKKVTGEKKPRAHPPYAEMIKEAIASLKERGGSSQVAIARFVEDKHKVQNLAPNYKKLLLSQLKRLVASGNLVKVKHSFKLGAPIKSSPPKAKAPAKPKKAETKPKKAAKATATPVKAKKVVKAKKATPKKKAATPAAVKAKKVAMKVKAAGVKKPKSIKSPAKKIVAAKKAKK